MFGYYFKLGLKSLRRNPALTALMVLTLAIGVAASVATLTILHMMSNNPIPHKSERLLVPLLDNGPMKRWSPGADPSDEQMAYPDATNLLRSGQGQRRTAMYGVYVAIEPAKREIAPFNSSGLAPTRDFFSMFEVPFLYGQAWTLEDEAKAANVVVLGRHTAAKLFGDTNPVGQRITLTGQPFTVVGVANDWAPKPRYYKLIGANHFGKDQSYFIPFATAIRLELKNNGNMSCSGGLDAGFDGVLRSECTWIQFWFETASSNARAELQTWLDNYMAEQRKLGRMPRPVNARLFDVVEWMQYVKVVGNDNKLAAWLSFGFLALCLVNTVGLLLAKFSTRASEIGVRRALGASKKDIFSQFLVETGVIGLVGGVLGLVLAFGALGLIGMQNKTMAEMASMDWQMLTVTFVISITAALLAGVLPIWRACQVTPAIQLKSQ